MFFIPLIDRTTNLLTTLLDDPPKVELRGFNKLTYPGPELFGTELPVNLLAFNRCKTQRDIYLYSIGEGLPESWERYQGRVIHHYYEALFTKIRTITTTNSIENLDILNSLYSEKDSLKKESFRKYHKIWDKIKINYSEEESVELKNKLDKKLDKIFNFEVSCGSCLINFEISRLLNQNTGEALFQKASYLQAAQQFGASSLGFTKPVSPDFIYKNVVGDIKSGPWKDYFEYTITAYALAVENHTNQKVDCGIILHMDLDKPRKLPIYEQTHFRSIDDSLRRKFITIRDQKLYISKNRIDPGLPDKNDECIGCGFYNKCWGDD